MSRSARGFRGRLARSSADFWHTLKIELLSTYLLLSLCSKVSSETNLESPLSSRRAVKSNLLLKEYFNGGYCSTVNTRDIAVHKVVILAQSFGTFRPRISHNMTGSFGCHNQIITKLEITHTGDPTDKYK